MATVHATMQLPPDEASTAIRRQAAALGYALAEGQSGPRLFVFTKGVTLFSWGSKLTVKVESQKKNGSHLTITTDESFAISDWGRGRRAALKLLDPIGAREV
jgi:hypothetical protein